MPTTTPLGKVSITPKGEFTPGTEYHMLDVVYSPQGHAAFLARKDSVNVGLEDADTWMKLAQGMDGESAFDAALAGGYAGTKEEFYRELADFNGYAAQAKESADSATASKEAARQAAETATNKAEEMHNTLGTQPEGAGTVWENIGERPEGKTGTLWENASSDLTPIANRLTTVENRVTTNETNITTITGSTNDLSNRVTTVEGKIGSGFTSSNTILSNIGTRPAGKTGTLWTEIEKGEHSITSPANVTLTGTGNTKVNSNNSYYIKSGNLVLLVVNCLLQSTDRNIDVRVTGVPRCAGKHVDYDLSIPIAAIDFSLNKWSNYPQLRLNPGNPSNPAGISAHYATDPVGTIYLTLAGYAVYIAAQ